MSQATHDVLFVHESKHHEPVCPIHLLPMGVISMANWLVDHGVRTEIIHHAVERVLDPGFDVIAEIQRARPRLVAIDLHWHAVSRNVMHLAARIKERCPGVQIVVGGYTASSFTEEILREWPQIDFVIRGDGEEALLALARHFTEGLPLDGVPNLARMVDGEYVVSSVSHVNDGADLGRYDFCRFEVLRHWEYYCQAGVMEGAIRLEDRRPGILYCNAGRGCPFNCTFCGGGYEAQKFISGRKKVAWRPVDAMMRDLRRMADYGLDTWYNTYQPTRAEGWFHELYARVRAEGLRINAVQECLHIPSEAWIADFAQTFGPGSRIDLVLYNGNDELRKLNKNNYFSGQQVMDVLDIIERYGLRSELCCLTGLPHERLEHFEEHFRYVDTLRKRYRLAQVNAEILAIEPRAVMNLDPEGNAVTSHATTFRDFYEQHVDPIFIGFTPGRYSARVAQTLAAYTRVAHQCAQPACLFVEALNADPTQYTTLPVARWKDACQPCDRYASCYAHPLFTEIELYEHDDAAPYGPGMVHWTGNHGAPKPPPTIDAVLAETPSPPPTARSRSGAFTILDRIPAATTEARPTSSAGTTTRRQAERAPSRPPGDAMKEGAR